MTRDAIMSTGPTWARGRREAAAGARWCSRGTSIRCRADRSRGRAIPLAGTVEGNRLYGRGSNDMKGGVGTNLFVVEALRALGIETARRPGI